MTKDNKLIEVPAGVELIHLPEGWTVSWENFPPIVAAADDSTRDERKKEGRCQECGELLPMTIHGLGECEFNHATGERKK